MDATQKRRMWKVAIAHFLIALFVFWKLMHYMAWSGPPEREIWFMVWNGFWSKVFMLFEPQLLFFGWVFRLIHASTFGGIGSFLGGFGMMISVPLWSICFGWIFVKLDNWLNHVPVLGQKVF